MVKNPPANAGDTRHGFNLWVRKIPWSRKWQPTPVCLLKTSMDGGARWATVHGVAESDVTEAAEQLNTLGTMLVEAKRRLVQPLGEN